MVTARARLGRLAELREDGAVGEDDGYRHTGAWNSFKFTPEILHDDLLRVVDRVEELGYLLNFRDAGFTLEEVQYRLRNDGPGSFLRIVKLEEDISPKAPLPTVEEFVARRLAHLAPQSELIITDPFLFTYSLKNDPAEYAESVGRLISPLLAEGVTLTAVVSIGQSHPRVEEAVLAELISTQPTLRTRVVKSDDFHDRFWIADRSRGVIVGSSLNKIGSKIFFIDSLSSNDVATVVREIEHFGL